VEEYFAKDVASELGLSQTKLIRLAMLLGSDYTEGINGIGGYLRDAAALCCACAHVTDQWNPLSH
jgi:hypothetical protein